MDELCSNSIQVVSIELWWATSAADWFNDTDLHKPSRLQMPLAAKYDSNRYQARLVSMPESHRRLGFEG